MMSTMMPKYYWCLLLASILLLTLVKAQEQLTDREISENIERKLNETMESESIKYTVYNTTGLRYNASTKFRAKGMSQLYNFTNIFIDFIQDKQAFPEGLIRKGPNGKPIITNPGDEWYTMFRHYGGLGGLAIAGLLLAAILPCIGLFFCCCRCAGHCGARSEPFDKKHDHCRKVMLSMFLICVTTILLFGVICAFVSNEYMQNGTKELSHDVKVSLGDVKLYLTTTKNQIDMLLKTNYQQLELTLNNILQASGKIVTDQLAESSHAVSLKNLNDIVTGLESIRKDLKMMTDISNGLRNNASNLEILLRRVKVNLLHTLTTCGTEECKKVMHEHQITNIQVKVEFDKLPDHEVMSALNNLSQLMNDNIVAEVNKGMEQFLSIQKEIQYAVNQTIPTVSKSISRAGDSLASVADNINQLIDGINMDIDKTYMPMLDVARRHIDQYSPYRHYLGLCISGVLLTVLSCLVFGLFCGICGKRPDGYGDDCCNKGSGARFLMTAVWIIFLLTSILMIITVTHMITGVFLQRTVCEPLKNPNNNRVFALIEDYYVDVNKILYPKNPKANISLTHIINSCHRNESIYNVLKLQYVINVNSLRSYIDRYDINETIHKLEEKINLSHEYKIISESARDKLNALAQSGLSDIKFYKYTENLRDNITNINLKQLADTLNKLADRLPDGLENVKEDLIKNAYDLEGYHQNIVVSMTNWSNQLSNSAIELQEHIKFNHSSMSEAIHSLIQEVDKAQEFISQSGPEHVKMLAAEFGKAFIYQVSSYLDYVTNNTLLTVGKCGPMSNAYNATLVSGCNKILDPFNGFWASVGWCLILFLPTIILCVKLSALYQKSDPYPGPLVEAIHDKKYVAHHGRHHPGGGYPESYDGPAIGYSDRERMADPHQGSSHHESRYSDLAPNLRSHQAQQNKTTNVYSIPLGNSQNWDFPNGGPPRYVPAAVAPPLSTEYERPPPYYYPGPGDRN